MKQEFRVMAFSGASGLWQRAREVRLRDIIGRPDLPLEEAVRAWQGAYDVQFRNCPYEFDWDTFNEQGRALAVRIQHLAPAQVEIHYVESDDRDFFKPEDHMFRDSQISDGGVSMQTGHS